MRGRKPKPPILHIVNGNPSKKPASELRDGVQPVIEVPPPPPHLAGEALAEWHRITAELAQLGLVTAIDRAALTMYCEAWGEFAHAQQRIAELEGELIVTHRNGFQGPSPWLAIRDKAAEKCRKLLVEFGMSPSSRSRVKASPQGDLFGGDSTGGRYFE